MKTLSIQFTMFFGGNFTVLQKIITHYKAVSINHLAHNSPPFYAKQVIKEKKC